MNELQVIENKIIEMKRREENLKTKEGRISAEAEMLMIFAALNGYGYKLPDTDEKTMAKLWVSALEESIIVYGTGGIKKAVFNFVKNDTRKIKQCPTVGDIIAEAKKLGLNPKVELARIKSEKEIEEIIRKEKEEKYERYRKDDDF